MTEFIQNPITEIVDRPVAVVETRTHTDIPAFASDLLDFDSGMRYAKQAKTVALLGSAGISAETKKRDVISANPNDSSQTFTHEEEYVAGLPEDAQLILEKALNEREEYVLGMQETANKMLSEIKGLLVDGLSKYAKKLGFDEQEVRLLIQKRLISIKEVEARDWVFHEDSSVDMTADAGATYTATTNTVSVRPWNLKLGAELKRTSPEKILRSSMTHELEHAASYIATDNEGNIARTGITAEHQTDAGWRIPIRHGLLSEEGTQEDILWAAGLKQPAEISYMANVMFWRAAIAVDPTIERDRFDAKFINSPGSRGRLIGKIENLFGPLAIEHVDELIETNSSLRKYPDLKDGITQMAPEEHKAKVRSVLDQTQLEIFTPMGYGYSDDQLRELKRTGIMPDKPAHLMSEPKTES